MFCFHGLSGDGWFKFAEKICEQARVSVGREGEVWGNAGKNATAVRSRLGAVFRAVQEIKPDSTTTIWNHSNAAQSGSSIINLGLFCAAFRWRKLVHRKTREICSRSLDASSQPHAMTKVAWIYFAGECGEDPDKERGFKWFKLAYEAGSTAAGRLLAIVTCGGTEQLKMKIQAFAF
jgi:TPR repeat protein